MIGKVQFCQVCTINILKPNDFTKVLRLFIIHSVIISRAERTNASQHRYSSIIKGGRFKYLSEIAAYETDLLLY